MAIIGIPEQRTRGDVFDGISSRSYGSPVLNLTPNSADATSLFGSNYGVIIANANPYTKISFVPQQQNSHGPFGSSSTESQTNSFVNSTVASNAIILSAGNINKTFTGQNIVSIDIDNIWANDFDANQINGGNYVYIGSSQSGGPQSSSVNIGTNLSLGNNVINNVVIGANLTTQQSNAINIGNGSISGSNTVCLGNTINATSTTYSTIIGHQTTASGAVTNMLNVGYHNNVTASYATGIGAQGVTASANYSTAIGNSATASTVNALAIGNSSTASTNTYAMAIGSFSTTTGANAIAIGSGSTTTYAPSASGTGSIAIGGSGTSGTGAAAGGSSAISIGSGTSNYTNSINIGGTSVNANYAISIGASTTGGGIQIGNSATAYSNGSIGIGPSANTSAANGICIGSSSSSFTQGVAVGYSANAGASGSASYTISLGSNSKSEGTSSIAIGGGSSNANSAQALANNSIVIGNAVSDNTNASTIIIGTSITAPASTANYLNIGGNIIGATSGASNVYTATQGAVADQGITYNVPTTGFSLTIAASISTLILNPAGTLATGTVTMPAAPVNGTKIRVLSTQTITALTVSPNTSQSVSNAPSTIVAGTSFEYIYYTTNTAWYRLL